MNIICRIPLLFIILSAWIPAAYSQDIETFHSNIIEKLNKYCETVPREEVFIHTDRSEYVAGELLWFNVYLIDRQSNKPSVISRIAYFELLNSENRPLIQKHVRIEAGSGPGQITLPDTLSTGKYTIRAYTNWMKNFMPDNCFSKEVKIYNPFRILPDIESPVKGVQKDLINEKSLPSGVPESGLAIKVNNLIPDTLIITISPDASLPAGNNNYYHVLIQTHGIIDLFKTVSLSSFNKVGLPKKILSPGINQITLFDAGGLPVAERFIYTPSEEKQIIKINSPETIKKRDRISLEIISGKLIDTLPNLTNMSISIAEWTESGYCEDLTDYMVFGTEFGVLPDEIRNSKLSSLSPEKIDKFLSEVKSSWIDWKTILSGNFPPIIYKAEKEDHLLRGRVVAKNSEITRSDRSIFLSIPDKTPTFQYARTDSTGSFVFRIPIDEKLRSLIIQPEEVDENINIRIESSFLEEYSPLINPVDTLTESIPKYISKWSTNSQVRKIYRLPENGDTLKPEFPIARAKRFYGKPDIELAMADYVKLPTMEEVFFELTPGIIFKTKNSGYSVSIFDPVGHMVYKKAPVLFIDGVVVNDPAVIAGLDPALVEKIDAVTDLYLVGDYCFFGLVNLITKAGDYSCVALPPYAVRVNYRSVNGALSFFSPDYSTVERKQSRIPDLRNTLYWNHSVKPDNDGVVRVDIWASDDRGDYEINLQGTSSEGKPISIRKIIKVE